MQAIIRTDRAGVHYGEVIAREGREVSLRNARRVWSWQGCHTLNEMALRGPGAGSRISEVVPTIELLDAIEVIPVTLDALAVFERAGWGEEPGQPVARRARR